MRAALSLHRTDPLPDPLCVALFPLTEYEAALDGVRRAFEREPNADNGQALNYLMGAFEDCVIQQNYRLELSSFVSVEDHPERTEVAVVGRRTHLLVVSTSAADLAERRNERARAQATGTILRAVHSGGWEPDDGI